MGKASGCSGRKNRKASRIEAMISLLEVIRLTECVIVIRGGNYHLRSATSWAYPAGPAERKAGLCLSFVLCNYLLHPGADATVGELKLLVFVDGQTTELSLVFVGSTGSFELVPFG